MWNEIRSEQDIRDFMDKVYAFHDSCIKEMHYVSGASVNADLRMYPLNDRRVLNVIIQRQFEDVSMIEMEFAGLKYLNLSPVDEQYTCEIFGSTLLIKDRDIYWCDGQNVSEDDIEDYDGTIICAARLRWRAIDGHMGNGEFYKSVYLE